MATDSGDSWMIRNPRTYPWDIFHSSLATESNLGSSVLLTCSFRRTDRYNGLGRPDRRHGKARKGLGASMPVT